MEPSVVRNLIEQGVAQHQAGRLQEAKLFYEQALAKDPRQPDALHLLGLVALQRGETDTGAALIERAIQAHATNPAFHSDLAQAYLALRRNADALGAFRRAGALDPRNPQFAVGAAVCLALQGSAVEAERQLRVVTQEHPAYALAWYNLGNVVRDVGRPQEAADIYRRVIQLDPGFAEAYGDLGGVLHETDRYDDAEQAYRQHLALQPDSVEACFNFASLLIDRGRPADAARLCRHGIERYQGSTAPGELQWMLGSALAHQGQFATALGAFRAAAATSPGNAHALAGYGVSLIQAGNVPEGLRWLERAWQLEPESPDFRHAMAGVYLSLGDLQAGWHEYHARPARNGFVKKYPGVELANELPGGLADRKILLLREQGLGDELFFLRFAAGLKLRGAAITHRASAKIAPILKRVAVLDEVVTDDAPPAVADLAILVGDLPRMLCKLEFSPYRLRTVTRGPTNGESAHRAGFPCLPQVLFPEPPPPLALSALPQQLEKLEGRLAELGEPPYLGLTWRAGTAPEQQRGAVWVLHKEIPLEPFAAVMRGVNGTLLALQRNPQPGEIEEISARAARPVHDLTALNEDLESMLALLTLIDDYIGVSNTNMHLRAGSSRTARVLVPRPAEWRWMFAGNESPWFPGFRVYRQGVDGDWSESLRRLAMDLRSQFGTGQ